jgi:hypothetical protein
MLNDTLKTQLAAYLQRLTQPVEIVASLDERAASAEMRALLDEIAALSPLIGVRRDGADARRPSFSISRAGQAMGIRFAAIPMGHEFTSLVLALLQAGGHPPKLEQDMIEQIRALDGDFAFETYMSLSCHNCPDVVQALILMAVCAAFLFVFCVRAGMSPVVVIWFFAIILVILTAITRVRAELGPPATEVTGLNSINLMVDAVGTKALGANNLAMVPLFYWFSGRGHRTQIMPHQMEALKMAEVAHLSPRRLGAAMVIEVD